MKKISLKDAMYTIESYLDSITEATRGTKNFRSLLKDYKPDAGYENWRTDKDGNTNGSAIINGKRENISISNKRTGYNNAEDRIYMKRDDIDVSSKNRSNFSIQHELGHKKLDNKDCKKFVKKVDTIVNDPSKKSKHTTADEAKADAFARDKIGQKEAISALDEMKHQMLKSYDNIAQTAPERCLDHNGHRTIKEINKELIHAMRHGSNEKVQQLKRDKEHIENMKKMTKDKGIDLAEVGRKTFDGYVDDIERRKKCLTKVSGKETSKFTKDK